jgi:hypothetical protein
MRPAAVGESMASVVEINHIDAIRLASSNLSGPLPFDSPWRPRQLL